MKKKFVALALSLLFITSCNTLNQAPIQLTKNNSDVVAKISSISQNSTSSFDDEIIYTTVYKSVIESVVTVNVTSVTRRFFSLVPVQGSGSGFVIGEDGYILTNYHVIEGAKKLEIKFLNDETSYIATFVDGNKDNDVAVLKIDSPKKLKTLPLGNSDELEVGKKVMAIGNPFGLDGTLTTGIISFLNRTLTAEDGTELESLIQTDTAMNPGNSGGPLLNSKGEVIGINTAIFSTSGGNIGIGFAVPINKIKEVLKKLSLI